jgi:hypothetical protein
MERVARRQRARTLGRVWGTHPRRHGSVLATVPRPTQVIDDDWVWLPANEGAPSGRISAGGPAYRRETTLRSAAGHWKLLQRDLAGDEAGRSSAQIQSDGAPGVPLRPKTRVQRRSGLAVPTTIKLR